MLKIDLLASCKIIKVLPTKLRMRAGGKPIFTYKGGGGVKKSENLAYVVYGWSLIHL